MNEEQPPSSDKDLQEEIEAAEAEAKRQRAIESQEKEIVVYPEEEVS